MGIESLSHFEARGFHPTGRFVTQHDQHLETTSLPTAGVIDTRS